MPHFRGVQLTGRFSWNRALTAAARKYTREQTPANSQTLSDERKAAASEIIKAQMDYGFEYLTDGGVGSLDIFSPYVQTVAGVRGGGNINKYPGTRNSYYHTPLVDGKLRRGTPTIEKSLFTSEFPPRSRKKAILPSPVAFALACENTFYPNLEELVIDFSEILGGDVKALSSRSYDYIQLTESFLPGSRLPGEVSKRLVSSLLEGLDVIFDGFSGRSAVYFHSVDASSVLPKVLRSRVTDVGFDFNTSLASLKGVSFDKNLLLGLQNVTRKLPEEMLGREPEILAARARGAIATLDLSDGAGVSLCPSQDFDGLQTYPQAVARLRNLSDASKLLRATE